MFKTVEVPLAGHPDKVCDQIVDAILDEYLRRDQNSRVDLQALGSHGMVMIAGTVDSRADFDAAELARRVYKEVGYDDDIEPFVNIERPSEDLSKSIVKGGAQGTCVVHGYATRETREFLPRPLVYANAIARRIDDLRKTDTAFKWMCPDGKVQLTMDGTRPVSVTVLVQHAHGMDLSQVQSSLVEAAIEPILGKDSGVKMFVNTAGTFCTGGFAAGGGASGRKTLADTYGGLLPSGGAIFSGRDPLHPSRAGAYMARFAAKNLVAKGVAGNVLVSAAYTIGEPEPLFLSAWSGEGKDITDLMKGQFDFRPDAIVERLGLRKPIYKTVATFGQFGREGVPWEEICD
ncbi:MAG: methionine adenosyltransferase domain-containing protein [Candidatus Uhrbacteria bacterium]|nr:methionine adenosyltransferase domain-containing protein [Candidatus Uhrbacteria bacterium]